MNFNKSNIMEDIDIIKIQPTKELKIFHQNVCSLKNNVN
jgi:hypothetical protein